MGLEQQRPAFPATASPRRDSPLQRALVLLTRAAFDHHRQVLVAAALFAVLSPLFLRGLRVDTDFERLVPFEDEVLQAHRRSRALFGEASPLVVRLRPVTVGRDTLDRFTEDLAQSLRAWGDVRSVAYRVADFGDQDAAASALRTALLNSDPPQLDRLLHRLDESSLRRELGRTRRRLLLADDPALRELLVADPLNLRELTEPFFRTRTNLARRAGSVYFETPGAQQRFLIVRPFGSPQDTAYCEALLRRIDARARELKRGIPGASAIEHDYSGAHAFTAESAAVLRRDLRRITLVAFVSLLALGWAVFRRLRVVAMLVVPLLVSLLAVLLLARLFFNPVNSLTVGFAAVVLGLGVDVGLHLLARLLEVYRDRPEDALAAAVRDCGPALVIGVATTAVAFLALAFAHSHGLREFGLLTAAGLLLVLPITFVLFPALARVLGAAHRPPDDWRVRLVPRRVLAFAGARPWLAAAAAAIVCLPCLLALPGFSFETRLDHFFPDHLNAFEVARETSQTFGASLSTTAEVLIAAPSFEAAMAAQETVDRELLRMVEQGQAWGFESPSSVVPYPSRLRDLETSLRAGSTLVRQRRTAFFAALRELRFRDDPAHETYFDVLEAALPPPGTEDRPSASRHLINRQEGNHRLRTLVWPTEQDGSSPFPIGPVRRIESRLRGLAVPAEATLEVTGLMTVHERVNRSLRSDFVRVTWVGLLLVLGSVLAFHQNVGLTLLTLVPVALAVPFTLGALALLAIPFTPTGIALGSVVVGVGIDDAVHILVRARRGDRSMREVLEAIGPVITLTTLSTMIGFGALILSSHPVVRSLGQAITIGVAACWLFTLFVLPALHRIASHLTPLAVPAALLLGCCLLPRYVAGEEGRVEALLEKLEKRHQSAEAVSARFRQTQTLRQLEGALEVEGHLVFQRPHFMRVEMRGDEDVDLYCNGERVWIVDRRLDEVEVVDFEAVRTAGSRARVGPFPLFLFTDPGQIRRLFTVALVDVGGRERLRLSPLPGQELGLVHLTLDLGRHQRLKLLEILYANGDRVTTRFDGWKRLPRTSEGCFVYRR